MKGSSIMGFHPELIILVILLLVIFGPKKLPKMGNDIGKGIREFKKGFEDITSDNSEKTESQKSLRSARAELDQIERELAEKKATLAAKEAAKAENIQATSTAE
jgi:sec-independent protein translocase protein TatA